MKKHRSRAGLARGRVVDTRLTEVILAESDDAKLIAGGVIVATKLIWVQTNHVHWRRFVRFCRKHGLVWKQPVKPVPREDRWSVNGMKEAPEVIRDKPHDWHGCLEVSGGVYALRGLIKTGFIIRYEDCLDVGEPRFHYRRR